MFTRANPLQPLRKSTVSSVHEHAGAGEMDAFVKREA